MRNGIDVQVLNSSGKAVASANLDGNGYMVTIHQAPQSKFAIELQQLQQKLIQWKTGETRPSVVELDEALNHADMMAIEYSSLEKDAAGVKTQLGKLIIELNNERESRIADMEAERSARLADMTALNAKIANLETELIVQKQDKVEASILMLSRATATAIQARMAKTFPTLFTTKYPWACTYDDIDKRITNSGDAAAILEWQRIQQVFISKGIALCDVNYTLKLVRELGTSTSHPKAVIDESGASYVPTKDQFLGLIDLCGLIDSALKPDVKSLVEVLHDLSPAGINMFDSTV